MLAIPLLARLFPDAQFVHILRDGRDVALSLAGQLWGQKSAFTAARYWRRCVEAGLEDGRALGAGRYHELTYEELLATPERERWEWRDRAGLVHWRLTAWDRLPRARTSCLRTRSRVLKRLGRTAAP